MLPQVILNGRQLREVLGDLWTAVKKANNPPVLFRRENSLVRLSTTAAEPKLEVVTNERMYGVLLGVADYWKRRADGAMVPSAPGQDLAKTMVSLPDTEIPEIENVSSVPMFLPTGDMWGKEGYCEELRTYFYGLGDLDIPSGPRTQEDAVRGVEFLRKEVFVDFPFAKDVEFAHLLATLLLPFVRPIISGCTPIHLFEANSPGSGKTLLANVITLITTGKVLAPIAPSEYEEEMRKRITSLLVEGKPIVVLDNVSKELNSGTLAAAITGERWSDRPLGYTRIVEVPNRAVWILTGNNPRLSLEVARRCIRCRLSPELSKPWERQTKDYYRPNLLGWISENRKLLIGKIYDIIRSWFDAGKPVYPNTNLGSFESWSSTIGGILCHAKVDGFLSTCQELYEVSDPRTQEWEEFVNFWWEAEGSKELRTGDLALLAISRQLLPLTMGDGSEDSKRIRLGIALSDRRDSYIDGFKIVGRKDPRSKSTFYRLVGREKQKELL